MLCDEAWRLPTCAPQRGAVSTHLDTLRRENVQRALEVGPLLRGGHRYRRTVAVRMVRHLVAAVDDRARQPGAMFGNPARDEERGRDAQVVEHVEDPRHAHVGPVGLVRHGHQVVGIATARRQNRRLGVDVERQGRHGGRTAVPRCRHRLSVHPGQPTMTGRSKS